MKHHKRTLAPTRGRIGRLFSNYILARLQHPLIIIPKENKEEYINALKAGQKHKNTEVITSFFYKTGIARMENELKSIQDDIPHTVGKKGKGMSFIF